MNEAADFENCPRCGSPKAIDHKHCTNLVCEHDDKKKNEAVKTIKMAGEKVGISISDLEAEAMAVHLKYLELRKQEARRTPDQRANSLRDVLKKIKREGKIDG